MVGALVNGFSQLGCKQHPVLRPSGLSAVLAAIEALDVPFYLHPRNPLPSWTKIYEGHSWMLGPNWAFAAETAVHALRLIGSAAFSINIRIEDQFSDTLVRVFQSTLAN